MAYPISLAPFLLLAFAPQGQAPAAGEAPPVEVQPAVPQTVTGQMRLLTKEGEVAFDGVVTDQGAVLVKATIAGADAVAIIDLSTNRSLVDVNLMRQQGVKLSEPLDSIGWKNAQHERRRAHAVEVTLDGQMTVTSDISAIALSPTGDGTPGSLGYVLGRGLLDHVALILVLAVENRFYGIAESGKWAIQSETAGLADFPYEGGIVTLEIDGRPMRLFVDLTSQAEIELTPEGWTKLFGNERSGRREIRIGPFTRDVEAGLLFTAPPVEGAGGVIGLGFLESFALVLDGPAKQAHLMGAPTLSATGRAPD